MEPVRDMFSAVFFVAIGLLIEPALLIKYALPITVITIAVVLGKVLSCSFGAFVAGNDRRTSLRVGMGLAQIGEFSFIIASLGLTLKVTSDFLYPIAVTVSALTTLFTPYLIRSSDAVVGWFDRHAPQSIGASLDIYTRWVGELGQGGLGKGQGAAGKLVRKWSWQIVLNVILTAGPFVAAVVFRENNPQWFRDLGIPERWLDATVWAAAALISMPLIIASYRKLQALGMLLGEMATERIQDKTTQSTVKGVLSTSVLISGAVALGIILLLLSATILPSRRNSFRGPACHHGGHRTDVAGIHTHLLEGAGEPPRNAPEVR
jgi:CPA2 family monovalent cation:H+ antiporter-2